MGAFILLEKFFTVSIYYIYNKTPIEIKTREICHKNMCSVYKRHQTIQRTISPEKQIHQGFTCVFISYIRLC